MLNKFLIIFPILFAFGGRCDDSVDQQNAPLQQPQPNNGDTKNITGWWFLQMATGMNDGGNCNVFTNNVPPCKCISVNFKLIDQNLYEVIWYAIQNVTGTITLYYGAASVGSSADEILSFNMVEATSLVSNFQSSSCSIGDTAPGFSKFFIYNLNINGYNEEYFYMIARIYVEYWDKPFTVILCRKRFPRRISIWHKIVQNLRSLNINVHDLEFVNQEGCNYPSECQTDKIDFCY